jgi:serine/threonine-protein kinase
MKAFIKIILYTIVLFVLGILAGQITVKLLSFNRTVAVPDLRGKSMLEANSVVRSKGIYLRLEGEDYDSYIRQGGIIRQDIIPGSAVKEGREIGIVVSKGPRVQYVPDVVGQYLDKLEALLREKGMRIGKTLYVHSDKAPKNTIVAQRPEPSEGGSDILSVVVSLGDYEGDHKAVPQRSE